MEVSDTPSGVRLNSLTCSCVSSRCTHFVRAGCDTLRNKAALARLPFSAIAAKYVRSLASTYNFPAWTEAFRILAQKQALNHSTAANFIGGTYGTSSQTGNLACVVHPTRCGPARCHHPGAVSGFYLSNPLDPSVDRFPARSRHGRGGKATCGKAFPAPRSTGDRGEQAGGRRHAFQRCCS